MVPSQTSFSQRRITMNRRNFKGNLALSAVVGLLAVILCGTVKADVITEWNQRAQQALLTAHTSPISASRVLAIVHVSVFDAVNGIERRYAAIHADFDAPPGASRRAAAVQAAYAALVKLFPSQKPDLDAARESSLASIASDDAAEDSQSIVRGIEWGDRKSTRLNSSHSQISYAVFC